jgi:putative DNA methylase
VTERENERSDRRLIEVGFPSHQVGAETQRERDTGTAPPVNRLHVWWARRPLTPSRAAILSSLLPADTDPDWFLRQLGIEKVQVFIDGKALILNDNLLSKTEVDPNGREWLLADDALFGALRAEQLHRDQNLRIIAQIRESTPIAAPDPVLARWEKDNHPFEVKPIRRGTRLEVSRCTADPDWARQRIAWEKALGIRTMEDKYGYPRAYRWNPYLAAPWPTELTVLDPSAGGGSISFEALRLGCRSIANDLNPVSAVILYATLDYPLRFGLDLIIDIKKWGTQLRSILVSQIGCLFPVFVSNSASVEGRDTAVVEGESRDEQSDTERLDGFIYCRQVTCPHCGGEAPLLNTCWLSKTGDKWAVRMITDGSPRNGKVRFETYRVVRGKGPRGEDPNFATVRLGKGQCIHCGHAISSDEIKKQARGESPRGTWSDRLYCIAAVREQPKLDSKGKPVRFKSGARAGQIRTEKTLFYRPPNELDLQALENAERMLKERWDEWDRQGLIPTERIPEGQKTREPLSIGMTRWCDMFTSRQLLGHLILIDELNKMKPEIMKALGPERGRAVVTYLQFAIDKGLDYNSKQTYWHYSRGVIAHTFTRHDYSIKWTFGEMVFTGPNSGAAWGLSQVIDAYKGIAELLAPVRGRLGGAAPPVKVMCGTAANMDVATESVDLVCIDPPYYDNVQYGELSDYFYVWQRRTLGDLYPSWFRRRLTDKTDEAVANPVRDGSKKAAAVKYENLMAEIFAECRRMLKPDGIMTVMFTHKSMDAWEALTRSLINAGWTITSSVPVESEAAESMHQKDMASAASSIFLSCRKRLDEGRLPSVWIGVDSSGVLQNVREAVRDGLIEMEKLKLNPVDEMVASYGRALKALSESWPVIDGDDLVSPAKAMEEASLVVNQYQISRLTAGRIRIGDLDAESAMALTAYGVFGLASFDYDEALNMSRSLGIALQEARRGYDPDGARVVGVAPEKKGRALKASMEEDQGYYAPFVRIASKLRLARPEERNSSRLKKPFTMWDILHGLIISYREGDIPVARAYLNANAPGSSGIVMDILRVWASKASDDKLRKEAQAILFGLEQMEGRSW